MPSTFTAVSYGQTLPAESVAAIRALLLANGCTVLDESRESHPGFETASFGLSADDDAAPALRAALAAAPVAGVDTAVVPESLRGARRKFIIMDVDSTLIQQEVIELLATHAGTEAEVAKVTEAAMRGELDFAESLHHRVATLAGLPETVLAEVGAKIKMSVGAERLVAEAKAAGHTVAAVSGGFAQILAPLAARLGLDFSLANELEIVDGHLTGKVRGAVVDRAAKETKLRDWSAEAGIGMDATMAIGDGANDLDMMNAAALGVAFNAKPAVRAVADAQINLPNLDVALALAGIQAAR
ncbi:phosphoserine phosphatase [Arthrobacter sp. ERGS1:01]|uniref:phosphoserine phosphatase SerB n=1 Tax=Arthrobacter sp. ERGS1:01 TaxID=1704044 RepID=UPI0006B452AB|nr:phosphoserine phosphatase SerB [Arthrobacter sp. ERGS1:01]ALE05958.1 phosphoserine phosphatase [Arthrobacter sp. ERGS1:01]